MLDRTKAVATIESRDMETFLNEIRNGTTSIEIPVAPKAPAQHTALFGLGVTLLADCVWNNDDKTKQLTGWERRFVADVMDKDVLTDKQRARLKTIAWNRAGIDIDANTQAAS